MLDPQNGHSLSPIRAVILDYGDVISQSPDPAAISAMAKIFNLPGGQFLDLYAASRHGYDRGDFDAEEYWARIARAAGVKLHPDQLAQLRQVDVAMWSNVRPVMLRWVEQLRAAGLMTAMLSNMHDDMVQHLNKNADWTVNFDCLTLSSAIRMAKPDAEIFWHCLKCLDVTPHEALFIDDREPNVRTAQAIGIKGIVATSPVQLRSELAALGFTPLPE